MSKRTVLYAVSEGSYSDYRVKAIFTTEAVADAAVTAGLGDGTERYELFDTVPEKRVVLNMSCEEQPYTFIYKVARRVAWQPREWTYLVFPDIDDRSTPDCNSYTSRRRSDGPVTGVHVKGTDHERVRKVFGELRAKAMAVAEGIADE